MDASLDTDITIHLYKSGKEELLFSSFDKLYMYDFLVEKELKSRAYNIYERFMEDVNQGKIEIITNKDLIEMGIKGLFENYKESNNYLFDEGELHAIALAKAMGIAAFVSDDTKEWGPHETLVKELIEDVMPFAFYELLFLKFLKSEISALQLKESFTDVVMSSMEKKPMKFKQRIVKTVQRFSKKSGSKRDTQWLEKYCETNEIKINSKMIELKKLLNEE